MWASGQTPFAPSAFAAGGVPPIDEFGVQTHAPGRRQLRGRCEQRAKHFS
jgi:hypothetical protein